MSLTDLQIGAWNVFPAFGGLGVGNVYVVCKQADTTVYADLYKKFGSVTYDDGSPMLYAAASAAASNVAIQAALDACVECRNDYVIIMPSDSDYDLAAQLTMSKKSVHLICPAGIVPGIPGATNACRIDASAIGTAADAIAISDAACEVAGLWIKGAADKSGIEISALGHSCTIHHNTIGLKTVSGSATAYGIHGTGECTNLRIYNNFITVMYPTASQTIGGGIVIDNGTRALIQGNIIPIGGFQNTMSIGISAGTGASSLVRDNDLFESLNNSGSTFTSAITVSGYGAAMGNRVAMTTVANSLTGGAADKTAVLNYECTNGGTLQDVD
jgi:hypothetical protein